MNRSALMVVGLLALSGCKKSEASEGARESGSSSARVSREAPRSAGRPAPLRKEESRDVDFVWYSGLGEQVKGGTTAAKVILKPNPSGDVRVAVYEEFSGGAGNQWRASVWMASFLASTTLGRQLTDYEFGVSTGGIVDGPSAGALTTAAMMAAMNGVPVKPDVTMTGTVNPDGSVGPVGGIPHKLEGAAAAGKKAFGYPVGQRYSVDFAQGRLVDLHGRAQAQGVAIHEVRDIYEAYALLTGQTLARPQPVDGAAMDISPKMFQRMQAKTSAWQARTEANIARMKQQKSPFMAFLKPLLETVEKDHAKAARHQAQGMVPVAYREALGGAAATEMVVRVTRFMDLLYRAQEWEEVNLELRSLGSVEAEWKAFMIRLETQEPASAAGAVTQVSAYQSAVAAWACLQLAQAQVAQVSETLRQVKAGQFRGGQKELMQATVQPLMLASLYYPMAQLLLELGGDVLELADDQGKPVKLDAAALARQARAYTSAAKANLDYYDALITEERAREAGTTLAAAQGQKASDDFSYLLTYKMLQFAMGRRDQTGASAAMANLAAAQASYLGSARLVAEEYSLRVKKDASGEPVEVEADKALMAMLELAEQKAREAAGLAQGVTGAIPASAQREYQTARAQREGSLKDKLESLENFWSASLASQLAVTLSQGRSGPAVAAPAAP